MEIVVSGKRINLEECRTVIVVLRPQDYDTLLGLNTENRAMSESWIAELQRKMLDGRWKFNGDTIRISKTGKLLNGQHTLTAARRASFSMQAIIVTGLEDDTWSTIDGQRKRNFGQELSKAKIANYTLVASLTALVWKYHNRKMGDNNYGCRGDAQQLERQLKDDSEDINAAVHDFTSHASSLRKCGATIVCWALWAARKSLDADKLSEFIAQLTGEAASKQHDPVYELRERLKSNASAKRKGNTVDQAAICVKAVNLFRAGKETRLLTFRSRKSDKELNRASPIEAFPEIAGYPPQTK